MCDYKYLIITGLYHSSTSNTVRYSTSTTMRVTNLLLGRERFGDECYRTLIDLPVTFYISLTQDCTYSFVNRMHPFLRLSRFPYYKYLYCKSRRILSNKNKLECSTEMISFIWPYQRLPRIITFVTSWCSCLDGDAKFLMLSL